MPDLTFVLLSCLILPAMWGTGKLWTHYLCKENASNWHQPVCRCVARTCAAWSHHLSVDIVMVWSSSWSHANRNCTVPLCFWVRVEAKVHPIGGYCNSCSFAHWPGINSPQGQGAVSGILIGTSGLIFTSLHILLHLLENEETFCQVLQSRDKRIHLCSCPTLKDFTEWASKR